MAKDLYTNPLLSVEPPPVPTTEEPPPDADTGPGDETPAQKEIRKLYNQSLRFDNKSAAEITKSAATKMGINPYLLFSSAFQEGMNQAISSPDNVSEAFMMAQDKGLDTKTYPVDGFYNYGLDYFGADYNRYKKYLPEGFDQRFKAFDAVNEKGQKTTTAAFKTNEDALIAKSAIIKDMMGRVTEYAKKRGVPLDENALNYFTLASYNGGLGNAKTMIDEFVKAKDKNAYIKEGQTTKKQIHKHISPRLENMQFVASLF